MARSKGSAVVVAASLGLVALALLAPDVVLASSSGGGGMPWESPLQTIVNSLKGPVAFGISLLGIVATGITLIWGGEVSEFVRRMVMLVLVISVIVFASSILSNLFGVGAVVP